MKACIVGHGPSILLEPMGKLIDEFDVVIRLKRCHETLNAPDYYGTKTDIVGGSITIAGGLRDLPADEFWVWVDSRHEDKHELIDALPRVFRGLKVWLDKSLCDAWDAKYRKIRDAMPAPEWHPQMKPSRYCDDLGERHLSQGFKAILYACNHLKPDELVLAGFDNVYTGEFHWSITRGQDWKSYPQHRWDIENIMLPMVEAEYGTKIGFLLPEVNDDAKNTVCN